MPALFAEKQLELTAAINSIAQPRLLLVSMWNNGSKRILLYTGWFLLPLLLPALPGLLTKAGLTHVASRMAAILGLVGVTALATVVLVHRAPMPNLANIIDRSGIGPLTLRDTLVLQLPMPELPDVFWTVISAASVLGAILVVAGAAATVKEAFRALRSRQVDAVVRTDAFLLTASIFYVLPLALTGILIFDRYVLPVLPLIALAVPGWPAQRSRLDIGCRVLAVAVAIVTASFVIGGTRDYLEWNRVRWAAIGDLMRHTGITPQEVDGGFEFNGWISTVPNIAKTHIAAGIGSRGTHI